MSLPIKDTLTLKGVKAKDIYNEVIGFMAVNSYDLYQAVEPVKICGSKEVRERKGGALESVMSKIKGPAKLEAGLWQRGEDLTVVLDFNKSAASDADTIKVMLTHKFGKGEVLGERQK